MTFTVIIIFLALVFDYINGFHDAANSIATVVSTKVLSPFQAVLWAAFFNFMAFYIFSDHKVANTVAKIVHQEYITHLVIFSGLLAAIVWNLMTWWWGIPSSSSHALIGGFAGAAIAHSVTLQSIATTKILQVIAFIFLAPIIGLVVAFFVTLFIMMRSFFKKFTMVTIGVVLLFVFVDDISLFWRIGILAVTGIFALAEAFVFFTKRKALASAYHTMFKRLQLLSSAIFSLSHGGNDAQKVMGIIGITLIIDHQIDSLKELPVWVPLSCYVAIGLGTLSGGWRIVKTMGSKITKVSPLEGVSAETSGALTLFLTASLGIPVSTTHTISGSIMGVGLAKRMSAVRWSVAINLLWAWVITIPITILIAMLIFFIAQFINELVR